MSSLELLFVYKVCNALQLTPPSVERLYTCTSHRTQKMQ